eukprot:g2105.t1
MASNLAKKGYRVSGWNRTLEKQTVLAAADQGVVLAASIQEATQNADVVFSCITDAPDIEIVYFGSQGAVHSVKANTLFIDTSTIGRKAAKSIAGRLKEAGHRFMDVPVSGGDTGAKAGTLTMMVGGSDDDLQEAKPMLSVMGTNITHCGPVGSGQAVKLCNQVLCGVHMIALCEAIALADEQEIDPMLMIKVCSSGAAGSWALSNLGPKICEQDYSPGFSIKNIVKDLKYCQEAADGMQTELPGTSLAKEMFEKIDGELGTQGLFTYYEKIQSKESK